MTELDINSKIKEVIEATVLTMLQEQSEKIEKLEKIVELQQQRIYILEQKNNIIANPQQQRSQVKHNTMNPTLNSQIQSQQHKPDPSLIKIQQKKLEQEKEQIQNNKFNQTSPQDTKVKITQDNKINISKQAIKNLPDPKALKGNDQKIMATTLPSKLNIAQKQHTQSARDIGMKKSQSTKNGISLITEQQVKDNQSPKQQQKKQQDNQKNNNNIISQSPKIQKNTDLNQDDQQINNNNIQTISQEQINYNQQQLYQEQNIEIEIITTKNNEIIENQDETIALQVEFKNMTIETFNMVEMNFVNDLLSQSNIPDLVKQAIFVFLLIVDNQALEEFENPTFWQQAVSFLQTNEKLFPQILEQTKLKQYNKSLLIKIKVLIENNKELINPDNFEDIDALACSISYFLKDFHTALQKLILEIN